MKYIVLLGRIFYSAIFILAGPGHFKAASIAYAASRGVPMPSILVPLSGVIAIVGGLSILLGFKGKVGAWLIVVFLVPVTLMIHHFWTEVEPMSRMMQLINFEKNLSMLGGALLIAHFGPGPLSMDKKR